MAAISATVGLPTLLDQLFAAADRVKQAISTGDLTDGQREACEHLTAEIDRLIDIAEDILDGDLIEERLTEARLQELIPWETARDQLGR